MLLFYLITAKYTANYHFLHLFATNIANKVKYMYMLVMFNSIANKVKNMLVRYV